MRTMRFFLMLLAMTAVYGRSAETPKPAAASDAVGPLVDVMLQSGESRKGQLLAYSGGQISVKMESGEVVTQDGSQVRTVRFIQPIQAPPAPPVVKAPALPGAQETELSPSEVQKIFELRKRQVKGPMNKLTKEPLKEVKELTREEEKEFLLLRAKLDLHIKALEREIKTAESENKAMNQVLDYARSQFQFGTTPDYLKPLIDAAVDSILNEGIRAKVRSRSKELTDIVDDRFRKALKKPPQ